MLVSSFSCLLDRGHENKAMFTVTDWAIGTGQRQSRGAEEKKNPLLTVSMEAKHISFYFLSYVARRGYVTSRLKKTDSRKNALRRSGGEL